MGTQDLGGIGLRTDYKDILDAAHPQAPLWWDHAGAPRFTEFSPELAGKYLHYVAYQVIECDFCKERFVTASIVTSHDYTKRSLGLDGVWQPKFPTKSSAGSFTYGYPPYHECRGDVRWSNPICILQFWQCDGSLRWDRLHDHEVRFNKEAAV